jgi:hypothetical protein
MQEAARFESLLRMRLASIELVGAFAVFYLFRQRRRTY